METIEEKDESTGEHPLLILKVLQGVFKYASVNELKTYRLVCEYWKHSATPFLREKGIVKLEGVCKICKSEWKLKSKEQKDVMMDHDHRKTISFYRFILEVQSMFVRDRQALFYKNFHISKLNLYFIPRLSTEPTKYFLLFVKLFGANVFELTLDSVQLCPTEAVYRMMPFFKNLESIRFNRLNVWTDPVSHLNTVPAAVQSGVSHINSFLTSLTISGDWMSEEMLTWDRIFLACPVLQDLRLIEVPRKEIVNCISTLVSLPKENLEMVKIRKMTIHPRAAFEDHLNLSSATHSNSDSGFDDEIPESNKNDKNREKKVKEEEERECLLSQMDLTQLLTQSVTLFTITDLNLRLPYTEEGSKYPSILAASKDKLNSLTLVREAKVFMAQSKVVFKQNPFELKVDKKYVQFPFIQRLEIVHNFIEEFDEIKQSCPSLQVLKVNIIPTEFCTRKSKPYQTYLRTNLLLTVKQQIVNPTVTDLTWNIEAARNGKTGRRTVLYKSNALKHVPRIFPNVVKLCVSITRATDLHTIFREMVQLTDLTILQNSFYRTKDEDIIGWGESDSESEEDDTAQGIKKRVDKIQNAGIKQLKNLERLTLDNNNCCLTNKSVRHGFVYLRKLKSLHISRGKRITLFTLRILRRCPYLVSVTVTMLKMSEGKDDPDSDDEAIAAYQLATLPSQSPLLEVQSPFSWTPVPTPPPPENNNSNSKLSKTKIPSLLLSPYNSKKMSQYTAPIMSTVNLSIINNSNNNSKTKTGTLPILVSTKSSPSPQQQQQQQQVPPKKENLVLPPLPSIKNPVTPVTPTKTPSDPLPGYTKPDLKFIMSLSETELEKFEEEGRKRKTRKETVKSQLGEQFINIPSRQHSHNNKDTRIRDMELARLKSEEQLKKVNGGKYDSAHKYSKIGGKMYSFVRTSFKVNGRPYQLIRRKYENEGEDDKAWAKQRAWMAKKKLQQQREAAKSKTADLNQNKWDKGQSSKKNDDDDEESEYERSLKDYDEDYDDEEEEYCDCDDLVEEEQIDLDPVIPERVTVSDVSETETSEEEGIFMDDDSNYEGDFYDTGSSSGQDGDEEEEEDSDFTDGSRLSRGVKGKELKKHVTFQATDKKSSQNKKSQIVKEKKEEKKVVKDEKSEIKSKPCHLTRSTVDKYTNTENVTVENCVCHKIHHEDKCRKKKKCQNDEQGINVCRNKSNLGQNTKPQSNGNKKMNVSESLYRGNKIVDCKCDKKCASADQLSSRDVVKSKRRYRSHEDHRIVIKIEPIRENSFSEDVENDFEKSLMRNSLRVDEWTEQNLLRGQNDFDPSYCEEETLGPEMYGSRSTRKRDRILGQEMHKSDDQFDLTLKELRCQMIQELEESVREELIVA